jgi:hypothetical protein
VLKQRWAATRVGGLLAVLLAWGSLESHAAPPAKTKLKLKLDPAKVYIEGTLNSGVAGYQALCLPETPHVPLIAFPRSNSQKRIRNDGSLIYIDEQRKLRQWVPDEFIYDRDARRYRYPKSDVSIFDDPIIPTPASCKELMQVHLWPDTSDFAYICRGTGQLYDSDGTVVLEDVLYRTTLVMLGMKRTKLIAQFPGMLKVLDAKNRETLVKDAPGLSMPGRAKPDGFWLVGPGEVSGSRGLWHLSHKGKARRLGTYAQMPEGVSHPSVFNMDAKGNLYATGEDSKVTFGDLVVRIPLLSDKAQVIYTEVGSPEDDWSAQPPRLFVRMHGDRFITGP